MKAQAYQAKFSDNSEKNSTITSDAVAKPKILHRSEKEKKTDELLINSMKETPAQPYSRFGGWQTIETQ